MAATAPSLPQAEDIRKHGAVGGNTGNQATAIQATIDAVNTAGGGIVYVPAGTFRLTAGISIPANVYLHGAGQGKSILQFTELGSGQYAVTTDGFQNENSTLKDLSVKGPGSFVIGVQNANCDGVYMAQSVNIADCFVSGFRAGLVMNEDHNEMRMCKIGNCYFNILYPHNRQSKGNQTFYQCYLEGANFACVAVFGNNNLDFVTFIGGNCGAAPYGFYKADAAVDPYAAIGASAPSGTQSDVGMMVHTKLINFAFESIGNAAFLDESTGSGNGGDSMIACDIEYPGLVWDAGMKIAARDANYAVNLRNVYKTTFRNGQYPFTTGATAAYKFAQADQTVVESPIGTTMFDASCALVEWRLTGGGTKGRLQVAKGTISQGDLLEWHNSNAETVRRYTGSASFEYAGVAMNDAVDGARVIVAYEGEALINLSAGVGPGWAIKPDATTLYHGVGAPNMGFAGNGTPTLAPVVGVCVSAGGPGLTNCRLIRMHDRNFVSPGVVSALPTAGSAYRNQLMALNPGGAAADTVSVCLRSAAGTYSWVTVATG